MRGQRGEDQSLDGDRFTASRGSVLPGKVHPGSRIHAFRIQFNGKSHAVGKSRTRRLKERRLWQLKRYLTWGRGRLREGLP